MPRPSISPAATVQRGSVAPKAAQRGSTLPHEDGAQLPKRSTTLQKEEAPASTALAVGDVVNVGKAANEKGVVKFVGETQFMAGDWVGVELTSAVGKNDGTIRGVKYFDCKPMCGIFVRPEAVKKVEAHEPAAAMPRASVAPVPKLTPEPAAAVPRASVAPVPKLTPEPAAAVPRASIAPAHEPAAAAPRASVAPAPKLAKSDTSTRNSSPRLSRTDSGAGSSPRHSSPRLSLAKRDSHAALPEASRPGKQGAPAKAPQPQGGAKAKAQEPAGPPKSPTAPRPHAGQQDPAPAPKAPAAKRQDAHQLEPPTGPKSGAAAAKHGASQPKEPPAAKAEGAVPPAAKAPADRAPPGASQP